MSEQPLDLAAIMTEHERHPDDNCYSVVVSPVQFTHCQNYRLAAALTAERKRVQRALQLCAIDQGYWYDAQHNTVTADEVRAALVYGAA